jgi:transposase
LARALAEADIECTVAAPSKLIRPASDRVRLTPATLRI